jgi:Holliday junction DNA helicase RuvA
MIGRITGRLVEVTDNLLLIDVNGIAYEIEATAGALGSLTPLGEEISLHTHFVVREDSQSLFGFASRAERDLFRGLIKTNGVGPKLALALLSSVDAGEFARCVRVGDVGALTKVPGIGRKTAERLVLELKDRISGLQLPEPAQTPVPLSGNAAVAEAERALISLGYKPQQAARAVDSAYSEEFDTEQIVRAALRQIAREREVLS